MRQFELHRGYRGRDITALVLQTEEGVSATLWGGDRPHIGAVGVADPDGKCTVTEFPGHKEGVVCEKWTTALAAASCLPAVVTAGIHYDGLDKAGIVAVLALTDELLAETLRLIAGSEPCRGAP